MTSRILLLVAVVCFVLAAFGIDPVKSINLGWAGLAFFVGSSLA